MKPLLPLLVALGVIFAVGATAEDPLNAGDPNCDGTNNVADLTYTVAYLFQGGPAPCNFAPGTTPIALGTVSHTGVIWNGSGNFTVNHTPGSHTYQITIAGEYYYYTDYVTLVQPLSGAGPHVILTSSGSGNLLVYNYDLTGTGAEGPFQFAVYKLP